MGSGRVKGTKLSKSHRKNISKHNARYWLGKTRSKTFCDKVRKTSKGIRKSEITKKKISKSVKKSIIEHHKYGKRNSDITVKIPARIHPLLHSMIFDYVYDKFGKKELDRFHKWFMKKVGYNV